MNEIDIPDDFEPGYELEEECPCGCEVYRPSILNIAEGWAPMNIELCDSCDRPRLNVSIWCKKKGLI